MSRARCTSHVFVVADDLDQAVEDLTIEWSADRRQRWVLDVDAPATETMRQRPELACRTGTALRASRLRAEREAVRTVAPHALDRLHSLDLQVRLQAVGLEPTRARGLQRS